MDNSTILSAEGRVLSARNASRLKTLIVDLGKILSDADISLSDEELVSLQQLLTKAESVEAASIEAGCLQDQVEREAWYITTNHATQAFQRNLLDVLGLPDNLYERNYGKDRDRTAKANELINDFSAIMRDQIQKHKSLKPRSQPTLTQAEAVSINEDTDTTDNIDKEEAVLEASSLDILGSVSLDDRYGRTNIEAASNQSPFTGVLFLIDEPSESAPSKGSSYPLYVPRNVAERCVEAVAASPGLPLDVDASLSCHAKENIAGVINKAEIVGNEFLVYGHLFPWNQEDKVRLISANRSNLGMSMNARASGHIGIVGGQKVFHIDSLELMGANILKAAKATWQRTKVIVAEIAASASESFEDEDIDLDDDTSSLSIDEQEYNVDISKFIDSVESTLDQIVEASSQESARIDELAKMIERQNRIIERLQQKEEAEVQASKALEREAEAELERESLLSAVRTEIEAATKTMLDSINPSRSPRRVVPLVQASGEDAPGLNDIERELLNTSLALEEARKGPPGAHRAHLIEKQSQLKQQLMEARY